MRKPGTEVPGKNGKETVESRRDGAGPYGTP
jgi:hypothetical protein